LQAKFRRGVQVEPASDEIGADRLGRKGVKMRLVAWRNLQRRRIDLEEVAGSEPGAERGDDPVAEDEAGSPSSVALR
jgi:hypothetical protein